jgi:hypothetical protein
MHNNRSINVLFYYSSHMASNSRASFTEIPRHDADRRHILSISDLNRADLDELFSNADHLQQMVESKSPVRLCEGRVVALVCDGASTE